MADPSNAIRSSPGGLTGFRLGPAELLLDDLGIVVRLSAVCVQAERHATGEAGELQIREAINNNPATETTLLSGTPLALAVTGLGSVQSGTQT